jgi:type I restriction enzyme S subunit
MAQPDFQDTVYGQFGANLKVSRLEDLCVPNGVQTGPFGSQLHQEDYVSEGTPIITVEHLGENQILHTDLPRVSDEDRDRLSRYKLQKGDIVFSRVGSVDRRSLVRKDENGWIFSGRCLRVRPEPTKIDSTYLSYFFGLPAFKKHIRAIAVGATMPSLNTQILSDVVVVYPEDVKEQKRIAHILGTLDDKIELNRKMNATLEAMARALFKSWFADFGPVRAKMEGRQPEGMDAQTAALFPDELVESELGMIPRGWDVGVLENFIDTVIGGDWGNNDATPEADIPCYCIRGADIPFLQEGGTGRMPIRYLKASSVKKRELHAGDLAIEISGGSPTQCTGRPVLISELLRKSLDKPIIASNFCRIVKLRSKAYSKFIYCWLRGLYDADLLFQFETGTTGIKNFGFVRFAEAHPLIAPEPRIVSAFDDAISPLFARIHTNAAECRTLAALRDSLLPKLLNGESSYSEHTGAHEHA